MKEFDSVLKQLADQAGKTGGLFSKALIDIIVKAKETGKEFEALTDIVRAQSKRAADGLTAFLTTGAAAYDKLAANQITLAKLQADYADATPDQQSKIKAEIDKVTAAMKVQQDLIAVTGIASQAAATAFGAALAGVFAKLVDGGATTLQAIRQLQPAIAALETQLTATGLSGGAAFDVLKRFVTIASDAVAGPALDAVSGLNDALVGMNNLGLLNKETFLGLTGQVTQTYEQLIKQGNDGDTVMRLMQPTLQTIWELEEKFGFKADDATQALLDQAKAAGVVGESHKSMAEQMLDLTKRMTTAIEGLAKVFGVKIPGELDKMGKKADDVFGDIIYGIGEIPTTLTIDVGWNIAPFDPGEVPQPNISLFNRSTNALFNQSSRALFNAPVISPPGPGIEPYADPLPVGKLNDAVLALLNKFKDVGVLWTVSFDQLLVRLRATGVAVEKIDKMLSEQTKSAAAGLGAFLTAGATAYDTLAVKQQELIDLQAQYASASQADQAKIQRAIAKVTAEIQIQKNLIAVTGITSQSAAQAFGASLAGVFAKLVDGGLTALEAVLQMQPAIAALETQLTATGLSGGAAFGILKSFTDLATDAVAGPALDAVSGLNQALIGMNNIGLLNQSTFAGLTEQVAQTYNSLIAQGKSGEVVMQLMQPTLQTIWQLQQQFGFQTDAATQALIDQAIGIGVVGEAHKSMADQMLDLTKDMVTALDSIAAYFSTTLPGSIQTTAAVASDTFSSMTSNIQTTTTAARKEFSDMAVAINNIPTTLKMRVEWDQDRGPFPAAMPLPAVMPQAAGGDYYVTKPTYFMAGEAGPEHASFSGANNARGWAGGVRQTPGSFSTAAMEQRLAAIEALLANQPRAMKLAMREALVMAA